MSGRGTWEQERDREFAIAADLSDLTLTIGAIAAKHNVSYSTVMRVANKRGLLIRTPGRKAIKK